MEATTKTMGDYVEEASIVTRQNLKKGKSLVEPIETLCRDLFGDKGGSQKLPRVLWLVASGSSFNASYCALPFMRRSLGDACTVQIVTPFSFVHYRFRDVKDTDLVLVLTQSGYSTNAIEALDVLRGMGRPAICVTGNVSADASSHADIVVDYGVGEELVGYVTKGVSTLVVFLMLLADQLSNGDGRAKEIEKALDAADAVQAKMPAFYKEHIRELTSMGPCYCCGVEGTWGIALEGALKIGETVHIPCFAYEIEEFIHGPNLQLSPKYTLFFFDPNDKTFTRFSQMYQAARLISDRAFLITANQEYASDSNALVIPAELMPSPDTVSLAYLPFVQLLSFYISNALGSTKQHPLLKPFKSAVAAKTENWVNYDGDE